MPLVGRDGVVTAIRELMLREGGGRRVLVLFGEAGTGKSRCIEELAASAITTVAVCRPEGQAAYAALSTLCRGLDDRDPVVLRRRPELRRALAPTAFAGSGVVDAEADAAKRRFFDDVARALALYATRGAVTLVLEDAHWSDLASLEALHHVALVGADEPLSIVLTAREEQLDEQRARLVGGLLRLSAATRLHLGPLPDAAAEALIDHELRALRRSLGRERRRAIVAAAGGNPLYLQQLTRHAVETSGTDSLPTSIAASVRSRLRALTPDVQQVLRVASALGEFDEELLGRIAGKAAEPVDAALRTAIDAGFVVRPGQPWLDLRFSHELVRRAIHEDVLPAERRRVHRAMLKELAAAPQLDPAFTRRAMHAWAAGERADAALWNERAGDAAFARLAFGDAAALYGRANAAEAEPSPRTLDKEALALERAGRPSAALPLLRRCLSAAAPSSAVVRARLLLRIARAEFRGARRDAAKAALEQARALLAGAAPSPEHYAVHVLTAWIAATAKETAAAFAALGEAEHYRDVADPESIVRAYEAGAIAHEFRRDVEGWRASYEAMVAATEALGDVVRHVGALGNFENSAFYLGETALAVELGRRAIELAEDAHCLELVPHVLAIDAYVSLGVGDLGRARRLVEIALPVSSEFPTSELIAVSAGLTVAVRTGDGALLERVWREQAFERAVHGGEPWQLMVALPALTEYYAATERPDRARSAVRAAMRTLGSGRDVGGAVMLTVAEYGLEREFPHVLGWLETETATWPHTIGYLHLYRALIARSGADRERHASEAVRAFAAAGYRLFEARARELAGDLPGAHALYAACGDARGAARSSPGSRRAQAPATTGGLTRREAQVAELAASGLSNREIGERLSLSDRTVEHHLGAVFAKLGVRSRVELAARRATEIHELEPQK